MIKSYRITYNIDEDDYIEYFCVQKEREGRCIGISAQNTFYDDIIFSFSTSKSLKEMDALLESGVAVPITEEEFIDGFNRMLKSVKEGCKNKDGK